MEERIIVPKIVEIRTAKSGNEFLYVQDQQKRGYSIFDKELHRYFEKGKATRLHGEPEGDKFFRVERAEFVEEIMEKKAAEKVAKEMGNVDTSRSSLYNATNIAVAKINVAGETMTVNKVIEVAKRFEQYLETGE
jgi:hypothetical protein